MKLGKLIKYILMWVVSIYSLSAQNAFMQVESDYEQQLLNREQSIELFAPMIRVRFLNQLASYYLEKGDLEKCYKYASTVINDYPKEKDHFISGNIRALELLSKYYIQKNEYVNAINSCLDALDLSYQIKDAAFVSRIQLLLGGYFLKNKDFVYALDYYRKALQNSEGQNRLKYVACIGVAKAHIALGELDSTLLYLDKAESTEVQKQFRNEAELLLMRGNVYEQGKLYSKALQMYSKAEVLANDRNELKMIYTVSLRKATVYFLKKQYTQALSYYHKAEDHLPYYGANLFILDFYRLGASLYRLNNQPLKSLELYRKYVLENENGKRNTESYKNNSLKRVMESHSQKLTIARLEYENALDRDHLRQSRVALMLIILLSSIGAFSIISYFRYMRQRVKNEQIIKEQQYIIEKQEADTRLKQAEVKAINAQIEGQERERDRLAKELHDGVGGSLAGVRLELELMKEQDKDNVGLSNIHDLVLKSYQDVRIISHNLSVPEAVKGDYELNILGLIDGIPGKNETDFSVQFHGIRNWNLLEDIVKLEVYRIIQEAASNILKHAKADKVNIQLIQLENILTLSIEDDGVGFDISVRKHGIGIRNMHSRVELLKGEIDIDSSPGNGTFININIPI